MPTVNQNAVQDRGPIHKVLFTGATATTDGEWFAVHLVRPLSLTVEGSGVWTVTIYVSNDPVQPATNDNNRPTYSTVFESAEAVHIDASYVWIRAAVSAYTSGSVSCFVVVG